MNEGRKMRGIGVADPGNSLSRTTWDVEERRQSISLTMQWGGGGGLSNTNKKKNRCTILLLGKQLILLLFQTFIVLIAFKQNPIGGTVERSPSRHNAWTDDDSAIAGL